MLPYSLEVNRGMSPHMEIGKLFKWGLKSLRTSYSTITRTTLRLYKPLETMLNWYISQKKWAGIKSFKQVMKKIQLSFLKDHWDYGTERGGKVHTGIRERKMERSEWTQELKSTKLEGLALMVLVLTNHIRLTCGRSKFSMSSLPSGWSWGLHFETNLVSKG